MFNDIPRALIVPDEARQNFLPTLFGRSHLIVAENAVYAWMERLSPLDYRGGSWDFFEHQGKPLFLAPRSRTRFRITGDVTCFQGEVSAEDSVRQDGVISGVAPGCHDQAALGVI